METIKATLVQTDELTNILSRAAENLVREDLNPIEEAHVYRLLRDTYNLSAKEIAQRLGKSETHIRQTLKALDLPTWAQEAVIKKEVSFGALLPLLSIDDQETREYYMKYAIQNGATQAVTRNWAASYRAARNQKIHEAPAIVINTTPETRRIYVPCDTCATPTLMEDIKTLHFCTDCYAIITGKSTETPEPTPEQQHGDTH